MTTLSLDEWCASADNAQRAYLAQSAVTHQLLCDHQLYGWQSLADLREVHALMAEEWPTVQWPALCGPRGADVSRFVPSLNELRMAPQDLHCLAYSHELAHVLAPTVGHDEVWARQQLRVLAKLEEMLFPGDLADALDAAYMALHGEYLDLEVIH